MIRAPGWSKFNARPVTDELGRMASQAEARRWVELKYLERAGEIHALRRQVEYPLAVGRLGHPALLGSVAKIIGSYVADFDYVTAAGLHIVEDVKGVRLSLYRWKKKHFEAQYGIPISETAGGRRR